MEMKATRAKRSLLPEKQLLQLKWRLEVGVKLTTALRIEGIEGTPSVYAKLLSYHDEMEARLMDDEVLSNAIRESLFPPWVDEEQPDNAVYNGYFPYGYWSYNND